MDIHPTCKPHLLPFCDLLKWQSKRFEISYKLSWFLINFTNYILHVLYISMYTPPQIFFHISILINLKVLILAGYHLVTFKNEFILIIYYFLVKLNLYSVHTVGAPLSIKHILTNCHVTFTSYSLHFRGSFLKIYLNVGFWPPWPLSDPNSHGLNKFNLP